MEPESSGFRTADQLQSSTVQDQAVQPGSARVDAEEDRNAPKVSRSEKVVIRTSNALIKGYLETRVFKDVEDLLVRAPQGSPDVFRVQQSDTGVVEDVAVKDAKAVFFVKTFEGNERHNELKFHTRAPILHGIWVRVEFNDGEVMEGIVHNSIHYLVDSGFFLLPTDPGSNNKLVYIVKKGLRDCRVLGVRSI